MSRLFVLVMAVCVAVSAGIAAQGSAVARVELPSVVTFPEGVAYDPSAGVAYTASAVSGVVTRVNLRTGASAVVAPAGVLLPAGEAAPFPAVLGMKLDGRGRLWIAGGNTGRMWVLDTRTGQVIKALQVSNPSASLINDVVLVGASAYFTDTRRPVLWRVQMRGDAVGEVQGWRTFDDTPLQYDSGNNLNGIAATPDGRSLIVVQMTRGLLFRIDLATKAVTAIDTAGQDLSGADGLVLDGHTLYVVRQTAVEIATVRLSEDYGRGTVVNRFTDPALAWPATAAKVGNRLYVVNTQFNARANNTATTPFTLAGVPLTRLSGR